MSISNVMRGIRGTYLRNHSAVKFADKGGEGKDWKVQIKYVTEQVNKSRIHHSSWPPSFRWSSMPFILGCLRSSNSNAL